MGWQERLDVAITVAQTLSSLRTSSSGLVYHDLTPYRVLFDKQLRPLLSCFGLMKAEGDGARADSTSPAHPPPEYFQTGNTNVTPESAVYSYGILLQIIIGGRAILPNQFVELTQNPGNNTAIVLDSSLLLEGSGKEAALELVPLVAQCLKPDPSERPTMQTVLSFLSVAAAWKQVGGGACAGAAADSQSHS